MRSVDWKENFWPRWLKLKDAAKYAAIGQKRLVQLAKDGVIVGFQDPDHGNQHWIFDRYSLNSYREGQAAEAGRARLDALDILESIRP